MINFDCKEKDFTSVEFWKRFSQHKTFIWYGSYQELFFVFNRYMKKTTDQILQIGYDKSALAEQIYDSGFRQIRSIDTDHKVIKQMQKRNAKTRPDLVFNYRSSLYDTGESEGSKNVVVDKGTLDLLLSEGNSKLPIAELMFAEVDRVLAPFGRYIIVTIAPKHVFDPLLQYFWSTGRYIMKVHTCTNSVMPLLVFVLIKKAETLPAVLEMCPRYLPTVATPVGERVAGPEALWTLVSNEQQLRYRAYQIAQRQLTDREEEETIVVINEDYSSENKHRPRFKLHIVDNSSTPQHMMRTWGVFVIPIGRETDWPYGSPRGRRFLRKSKHNFDRLIVVHLYRGDQEYKSMESVFAELGAIPIAAFRPAFAKPQGEYFSILDTMHKYVSPDIRIPPFDDPTIGQWALDRIQLPKNGGAFLRLISSIDPVQLRSEIKLKKEKKMNGRDEGEWVPDWEATLARDYHDAFLHAFGYILPEEGTLRVGVREIPKWAIRATQLPLRFTVLGIGAGFFAKFVHQNFPKCHVIAVEPNESLIEIARTRFEYPFDDERNTMHNEDPMVVLRHLAEQTEAEAKSDVIFVDIPADNAHPDISPPERFLTLDAFKLMRSALNPRHGVLAMNLVTPNNNFAKKVLENLNSVFPLGLSRINMMEKRGSEVLLCPVSIPDGKEPMLANVIALNDEQLKNLVLTNHKFLLQYKWGWKRTGTDPSLLPIGDVLFSSLSTEGHQKENKGGKKMKKNNTKNEKNKPANEEKSSLEDDGSEDGLDGMGRELESGGLVEKDERQESSNGDNDQGDGTETTPEEQQHPSPPMIKETSSQTEGMINDTTNDDGGRGQFFLHNAKMSQVGEVSHDDETNYTKVKRRKDKEERTKLSQSKDKETETFPKKKRIEDLTFKYPSPKKNTNRCVAEEPQTFLDLTSQLLTEGQLDTASNSLYRCTTSMIKLLGEEIGFVVKTYNGWHKFNKFVIALLREQEDKTDFNAFSNAYHTIKSCHENYHNPEWTSFEMVNDSAKNAVAFCEILQRLHVEGRIQKEALQNFCVGNEISTKEIEFSAPLSF